MTQTTLADLSIIFKGDPKILKTANRQVAQLKTNMDRAADAVRRFNNATGTIDSLRLQCLAGGRP